MSHPRGATDPVETGRYVDISAHPTWVDERGSGAETVVLLHGALSHSDLLLDALGAPLAECYRVVAFDRRGHGRTGDTPDPFHYDDMTTETLEVLERVVGDRAHLVGYGDGAIVALLVALQQPDRVDRMVLIGANFHHDGIHGPPLNVDWPALPEIVRGYGERSPDGPNHFRDVLRKSLAMITTEPTLTTDDLTTVDVATLIVAADDDLVRLDHTCSMFSALPAAQLAVVPGTSHALPLEKPAELARLVLEFLDADGPPQTLMPITRRPAPIDAFEPGPSAIVSSGTSSSDRPQR